MKIIPTPGRVMWFYPARNCVESGFAPPAQPGTPLASLVAHVNADNMVNLAVFDANGTPHARQNVPVVQEGEPVPTYGYYATWMPYQTGQARKLQQAVMAERGANESGLPG